MMHGTQGYFIERDRFHVRLSALTILVAGGLFGALVLVRHSAPLKEAINDPTRFGFEGPDHFVRRMEIESQGGRGGTQHTASIPVLIPETRRGGSPRGATSRSPHAEPARNRGEIGVGDAPTDALMQALRRAGSRPVFQSTELVIEKLVKPSYPEEAALRGIEGRVAVMALVDTVGRVVSVELISGAEGGPLERASSEAVWRCRFKPYRVSGEAREVYAVFRFSFQLY